MIRKLSSYLLHCLALLMVLTPRLTAVDTSGNIVGTVTDPQNLPVPGASVSVRNQESGAIRSLQTNERGNYSIPILPPGLYQIAIEVPNFRRATISDIKLNVNDTVRVDVRLELGEVRDAIQVSAVPPMLQADSSIVGQVVDRRKVTELPLNERNFLTFTVLVPGVQLAADGSQNARSGGSVSVNGAREQSNNFLLDGVDNNDSGTNQFSLLPSVDAIEEFKVQSSTSTAEFGRSGGAQINVVLKSGSNLLHGSGFEFLRNRHLDAKNFFDPPACKRGSTDALCGDIPRFDRNQFGFSLGGPIRQDRTFFFISYEGLRLREATSRQATVPSQIERAAALAAVPPLQRNPSGQAVLNLYPAANVGPDLPVSNRFVGSPVIRDSIDQGLIKVDYHQSNGDLLSGHYGISGQDRFNPFELANPFTNLPGFGTFEPSRGQSARLGWTHIFSSRLINLAQVGFNRRRAGSFQENVGTNLNRQLGFPEVLKDKKDLGSPNVTIAGYDPIGESITLPQDVIHNTFHFVNNMTWDTGIHQVKFGGEARRIQSNFYLDIMARGNWFFLGGLTGPPIVDLLRGIPHFAIRPRGDSMSGYRTTAFNFYLQDTVRIRPTLTVDIGLRYEYNSAPVDIRDRFSVPNLAPEAGACTPKPDCSMIIAGTQGIPRATYNNDRNNFAPRLGFAWQFPHARSVVVRGAYGLFYDFPILNLNVFPRLNPPFFSIDVFPNLGTSNIQTIFDQPGFSPPPLVGMVDPAMRTGYLQQWNFNVQYEPLRDLVLEMAYVGAKGTALASRRDINQPRPGQPFRPLPWFGPIQTAGPFASSLYHSYQLRAEKRLTEGLALLGAYTWSKSLDNASSIFESAAEAGFPQDSFNLKAERGLSNFHAAHRFVLTLLYDLPFGQNRRWLSQSSVLQQILGGWELRLVGSAQTGRPFTVNRGVDQSQTGTDLGFFDRPDAIADPYRSGPVANHPDRACRSTVSEGGRAAGVVRKPESWINPCAFASPSTPRFGTAGRNSLIGPGLKNIDVSLLKEIPMAREGHRLQVRLEFFNVTNHPNFDLPNRVFDSPTFAAVQSANAWGQKPPRQFQLGLRYVF